MILVAGGAEGLGYYIVQELLREQHRVVILDTVLPSCKGNVVFEKGHVFSYEDMDRVLSRYSIEAVVCAPATKHAQASHDEQQPALTLLQKMGEYRIENLVYSQVVPRLHTGHSWPFSVQADLRGYQYKHGIQAISVCYAQYNGYQRIASGKQLSKDEHLYLRSTAQLHVKAVTNLLERYQLFENCESHLA